MSRQVATSPQCWSAAILPLTSGAQTASKRQRSAKWAAPQPMFQASIDPDLEVTSARSWSSLWPSWSTPTLVITCFYSLLSHSSPQAAHHATKAERGANWLRRGAAVAAARLSPVRRPSEQSNPPPASPSFLPTPCRPLTDNSRSSLSCWTLTDMSSLISSLYGIQVLHHFGLDLTGTVRVILQLIFWNNSPE